MEAFLTVQTHFAAAHRLAKEEISFDENKKTRQIDQCFLN